MGNLSDNKRIAKNTIFLYFRMIFIMIVSLYTSRVVLNTLGVQDYGIYNVVGGIVGMLSFLNSSMAVTTQRFVTVGLAKGDNKSLQKIFSSCFYTHCILSLFILVIAESIGLWFFYNKMNIPLDRYEAALWVYQCSIITTILSIMSVPYNAVIVAHERMNAFAYISILEAVFKLLIMYILSIGGYDKLIFYAILILIIQASIRYIHSIYCKRNFIETSSITKPNLQLFKSILSFSGWSLFGEIGVMVATHGENLLLNIFFGPIVNAAKGISSQVLFAIKSFSSNFQMALNPQITKTYSKGEMDAHFRLIFASAKFSALLLIIISTPILIETHLILEIWLGIVPDYAVAFIRISIIIAIFDSTVNSSAISATATGQIKKIQIICGGLLMMIVPVGYLLLQRIYNPIIVLHIHLLFIILAQIARIFLLKELIGLDIIKMLKSVYVPCIITFLACCLTPYFVANCFRESMHRLIIVTIASCLFSVSFIYFIILSQSEKLLVNDGIKKTSKKIHNIYNEYLKS